MASPPPPDPYAALEVARDAPLATIKTQYRKLVLKFHPDKVQDESQKQAAADQFHKVQTAYEIIGDEDKRQRYDAQCKLADLRRDVMEKQGGGPRGFDARTTTFKAPADGPRSPYPQARGPERSGKVSPTYEERRPAGYAADYFDIQPEPAARRSSGYEREAKRKPPRDVPERSRSYTKEAERAGWKEKSKKSERDVRRDRDRKQSFVEDYSSDSDSYVRAANKLGNDDLQRHKEAFLKQGQKYKEDASQGVYDNDERARKLFSQWDGAQAYMSRSQRKPESERAVSPSRKDSPKEPKESRVENVRRDGQRPAQVRRGSERRSKTAEREEPLRRDSERRASADIVDEPRERRQPPPLAQTRSSPVDIRLPYEKPRAQSMQSDVNDKEDAIPKVKRAETMPHAAFRDRGRKDSAPIKSSNLRQTEFAGGYAAPAATPEWTDPLSPKYRYGQQYADDNEIPTPDGYRTQVVEPTGDVPTRSRSARSPSPPRGEPRESRENRPRTTSSRYACSSPQQVQSPTFPRTTSTSYVYSASPKAAEPYARPPPTREASSRGGDGQPLYGEVRTTASPRPAKSYQREVKPEDVKMASGYATHARRPSDTPRPSYTRSGSGSPINVR